MKIAIIQFPGSNGESESIRAIKQAGMEPVEFLWNENYVKLKDFDGYFIIGGFSYEDRSRAGIISALNPLMQYIKNESEKGKPILGICNGAQILVEAGMVPGLKYNQLGLSLATNTRIKNGKILNTGFYNTWIQMQLTAPSERCAFTADLKTGEYIHIPIAHAEGRFVIPKKLLDEMKINHLDIFRYCNTIGKQEDEFPTNPNGSVESLAAICNTGGNVMAMMPHPERSEAGQPIFTSLRTYIATKKHSNLSSLNYTPPDIKLRDYQPADNSFELFIELTIMDNEAYTVQATLDYLVIHACIKRLTHWEISVDTQAKKNSIKKKIIATGELYNSNKEKLITKEKLNTHTVYLLVCYKNDFIGQRKKETFATRFGIVEIKKIKQGTLWKISVEHDNIEEIIQNILDSHILYNQYSQICYFYNK